MKTIIEIFCSLGFLIGKIFSLFSGKGDYLLYLFRRALVTGYHKGGFKSFGKGSKLAPGLLLLNPRYITIGKHVSILKNCVLECSPSEDNNPEMVLGNDISIGEYSHITCARRIVIGDGLLTGRFVLITDNTHGRNTESELNAKSIGKKDLFSWSDYYREKCMDRRQGNHFAKCHYWRRGCYRGQCGSSQRCPSLFRCGRMSCQSC